MLHFQSMISYAQNLEDILLRRVFPSNKGFYIDIGVVFPTIDEKEAKFAKSPSS